jgi:hypothetical protein
MEAVMLTENPEFGQPRLGGLLSEDLVLLRLLPVLADGLWGRMAYDRRSRPGGAMSHVRCIDKTREHFKAATDGHGA